jgi:hypothetical protein
MASAFCELVIARSVHTKDADVPSANWYWMVRMPDGHAFAIGPYGDGPRDLAAVLEDARTLGVFYLGMAQAAWDFANPKPLGAPRCDPGPR